MPGSDWLYVAVIGVLYLVVLVRQEKKKPRMHVGCVLILAAAAMINFLLARDMYLIRVSQPGWNMISFQSWAALVAISSLLVAMVFAVVGHCNQYSYERDNIPQWRWWRAVDRNRFAYRILGVIWLVAIILDV